VKGAETDDPIKAPMALDEIMVTARKRSEALQEVPIAAAVVSGSEIAEQGFPSLQDLARTMPGVILSEGGVTDRQFIRGIGSGDNPSFEQSVGTFIDGLYHGRSRTSERALFDIEHVEVLKGPQSTYFGDNTIAGALNILTRDPDARYSGNARIAYTPRFNGYAAQGGFDFPVASTASVRLGGFVDREDGWIKDVGVGEDIPHSRIGAVRATLVWKPTETLTAKLKAEHSHEAQQGGLPIVGANCPQSPPFPSPAGFCAAAVSSGAAANTGDLTRDTSPGQLTQLDSDDYVMTLSQSRDGLTLHSVTGYSQYSYALATDLDATPLDLFSAMGAERYRQLSQELRLASDGGHRLEYMGGLYYQHSNLFVQDAFDYAFLDSTVAGLPAFSPLAPYLPLVINDQFRESADEESAFAELTWKSMDRLRTIVAARYTLIDKQFMQTVGVGTSGGIFGPVTPLPGAAAALGSAFAQASGLASVGSVSLSRRDSHVSPSLIVQFDPTTTVMLYARYDNGFKAGGFNGADVGRNVGTLPFSPETVNSFEIGAKLKTSGNRLTLDVDAFHSAYENLQLAGIAPTATGTYENRVQNAGGAVARGIELDAAARVTPRLQTNVAATYLADYYTNYPNAVPTSLQTLEGAHSQSLTGQTLPNAPRFSGSWSVAYERNFASTASWRVENRVYAQTRVLLDFSNDPLLAQRSYIREDVTLAIDGRTGWELSATARNLTNAIIRTYGAPQPVSLGSFGFINEPPRSVMIQLSRQF